MDFISTDRGLRSFVFKFLITKFLVTVSLIATLPLQAQSDRLCPAQVQQEVEKIAQSPRLQAARVGVFIQTNEPNPKILANLDGDRYFIPASNAKLFTTAIALKTLGADYRFTTHLLSEKPPNVQGELENGLWFQGVGDPSFSSATGLKSLVTQLKAKGIKRIKGGIWSMTIRSGAEIVGSWEGEDLQEYYAASVSPFTINENSLNWTIRPDKVGQPVIFEWENPALARDWRVENRAYTISDDKALYSFADNDLKVLRPDNQKILIISGQISEKSEPEQGGVAVPNPEVDFLSLLRRELIAQGIEISPFVGPSKKLPLYPVLANTILAIADSPPLSELVITTNKDSNNLYAELLLRALGEKFYAKLLTKPLGIRFYEYVPLNSVSGGISAIREYLESVNISSDSVLLADASGLSRRNLTTPRVIAKLLQTVASDRSINQYFRKSLAIAGVDGTLTNRFKNTAAQGLLQAKTGSLTGAIALSGYVNPPNYSEVIFSIMINNSNLTTKETQQYIDAIALLLTRLGTCR